MPSDKPEPLLAPAKEPAAAAGLLRVDLVEQGEILLALPEAEQHALGIRPRPAALGEALELLADHLADLGGREVRNGLVGLWLLGCRVWGRVSVGAGVRPR